MLKKLKSAIKSDIVVRKNEKNMLNLNKSNVIRNEIVKLRTQISLWSDKKMKKAYRKLK